MGAGLEVHDKVIPLFEQSICREVCRDGDGRIIQLHVHTNSCKISGVGGVQARLTSRPALHDSNECRVGVVIGHSSRIIVKVVKCQETKK